MMYDIIKSCLTWKGKEKNVKNFMVHKLTDGVILFIFLANIELEERKKLSKNLSANRKSN